MPTNPTHCKGEEQLDCCICSILCSGQADLKHDPVLPMQSDLPGLRKPLRPQEKPGQGCPQNLRAYKSAYPKLVSNAAIYYIAHVCKIVKMTSSKIRRVNRRRATPGLKSHYVFSSKLFKTALVSLILLVFLRGFQLIPPQETTYQKGLKRPALCLS